MSREEAEFEAKFAAAEADMRPNTSMAEVLTTHEMDYTYDGNQTGCSCGHWQARGPVSAHVDHAGHQAEQLAEAGFGDMREARTEGVAIVANAVRGPLISIVQALEFPASWAATERAAGG